MWEGNSTNYNDNKTWENTRRQPISLLPILSKLFQKIYLERLKPMLVEQNISVNRQFGFRDKHNSIE